MFELNPCQRFGAHNYAVLLRYEKAIDRLEQLVNNLEELNCIYRYPDDWKCENCKHRHLQEDGRFYCFQINSHVINTMCCKWFEVGKGGE